MRILMIYSRDPLWKRNHLLATDTSILEDDSSWQHWISRWVINSIAYSMGDIFRLFSGLYACCFLFTKICSNFTKICCKKHMFACTVNNSGKLWFMSVVNFTRGQVLANTFEVLKLAVLLSLHHSEACHAKSITPRYYFLSINL